MARRRKRQAKKTGNTETEPPAEEVDPSVTESESSQQDSSQQEEELENEANDKVESSSSAGVPQSSETKASKVEESEVPEPEEIEEEKPVSAPEETAEEPMEQDETKTPEDSSMEQQESCREHKPQEVSPDQSDVLTESTQSAGAEPVMPPEQELREEGAQMEAASSDEVKLAKVEDTETVEAEKPQVAGDDSRPTAESAPKMQDVEMKEKIEGKEEDAAAIRIEKEPTVPYCYDDDSALVQIDPEGDEGEVLIGNESPEFLKYWRAVLENPHDFTNWTYLLQLVEQENKPSLARRAYNGFFKRYPLCYGYWKKFAEFEKRNGNLVRAQRILERGVRAIPLSIDLWVHMIDFYVNFYKAPDAGNDKIRKVFERAVAASGEEFRSEKLWNKYLQWEKESNDWKLVVALYDRVLRLPTQHYAVFFKDFKEFVQKHSARDLLSLEEFEAVLGEVRDDAEKSEKEKKKKEAAKESNPSTTDDDMDPPGVEASDRGKPPNDKEMKMIGDKLIAKKKKIFEETEELVTKIWNYEEGIKRPYFHVKALERTQIKNWRDYLEAEMNGKDNHKRVVLLFERCLIACALYEDFWLKYARYLMKTDSTRVRDVYQRACEIHLPKKPNIHLHWASFEEQQGKYDNASKILVKLSEVLPNLCMVKMRCVAVERRAGHLAAAEELLKKYTEKAAKGTEEFFYTRKYVWFLIKVAKKVDVARQVLKDTIGKNPGHVQFYEDFVGLEFLHGDEATIVEACDLALDSTELSDETKYHFSQKKLEYLEDFGTNAKSVQQVYDDHQKLFRSHKKRLLSLSDSQPASKKVKTEVQSPTSGSKIQTTGGSRQTYSAKPTTNGTYASQVTVSGQPQPATPIQTTTQSYQQAAATGDQSLYYQNYWNYQTQKPEQYQYGQWPQYSQQSYYQQ